MPENELRSAIMACDIERVKRLLTLRPEVVELADGAGAPAFLTAGHTGSLPLLRYIVEYTRASLSSTDAGHRDLLHYATESGDVECCQYLVERCGMSPLRPDQQLETPYELAHRLHFPALEAYFQSVVGAPLTAMYHNPICRGMFPDPSIVRIGEDYYMVNSSFVYFPCIPISHSRDLIHWRIVGHAIVRPEWAALDRLQGGRGYWAPDISCWNGTVYICATYRMNDGGPVCRRQMVVTASRPEGPYSKPVFFDEDGIDPSIFHDEDGRHYMLLNRGARIFEMDDSATRRLSETTLLYYGDAKRAPEGPHLLKKDGWYYLFLAEGGTGRGHRVTVARSRTLHGLYTPCPHNPILTQTDEKATLQRCGHAKPVCTQHGEWYLVYLCGRATPEGYTLLGRETALDAIRWDAEGWPLINEGRGPSALQVRPAGLADAPFAHGGYPWMTPRAPQEEEIRWVAKKTANEAAEEATGDIAGNSVGDTAGDFAGDEASYVAKSAAGNEKAIAVKSTTGNATGGETGNVATGDTLCVSTVSVPWQHGDLLLTGSVHPLTSTRCRSLLVRRQTDFRFRFLATLAKPDRLAEGEAGIVCYYDEHSFCTFGLKKREESIVLQLTEQIGDDCRRHPEAAVALEPGKPLTLEVTADGVKRAFGYRMGEQRSQQVAELSQVTYLADEGLAIGKRFTGATVGVYALRGAKVRFSSLRYIEGSADNG